MAAEDESKEKEPRPQFSSKIGLVCSCLGCVVGTGNVWRFPRIVANSSGDGGGLVFLIVWFFFLIMWSVPMLLIEYGTGRYTQKAVIGSFRQFLGDKAIWCGAWISMVSFMISCYYSVVLGWCFYYTYYSIAYELPVENVESQKIFTDFAQESAWPVMFHGLAILIAGLSVVKGVKAIEKVNMVLVPMLLLILVFTFVWSLTLDFADAGIKFLFSPSWESFGNPNVWVNALSQNAFDTGAGSGLMIPYSAYMTRDTGIVKYGVMIPATNNLVSLISGITIFSTVFATLKVTPPFSADDKILDIVKAAGPGSTGLTFIWMPVLFSTIGVFGRVLSAMFFLCLSMAGVTSLISNMELFSKTMQDFGLKRIYGTPLVIVLTFLIGLMSALNLDILTNQDFVWGFALIINGLMLVALVVGYGVGKFRTAVVNEFSTDDWHLPLLWEWVIKFIIPLEGSVLIIWWAVDLISSEKDVGESWYDFGTETFLTTIVQWIGLMLLLVLINIIVVLCMKRYKSYKSLYEIDQYGEPLMNGLTTSETNYGATVPVLTAYKEANF